MSYDFPLGIIKKDSPGVDFSGLKTSPSLSGIMRERPNYQTLGIGSTDRILFVGYADGLSKGMIHQVVSLRETINILLGNIDSPLLYATLHAYYSGARDIYLLPAGPMVEFVPRAEDRLKTSVEIGKTVAEMTEANSAYSYPEEFTEEEWDNMTFYERYEVRLGSCYDLLLTQDIPQILVPLDAPFYDAGGVDFLTPLVDHCARAFEVTGLIRLGLIGSSLPGAILTQEAYETLLEDPRFDIPSGDGQFVGCFLGEVTYNIRSALAQFSGSPVTLIAALMSQMPLYMGVTHQRIPNAVSSATADLTKTQIETLSKRGINCIIKTTLGKRGRPFEVVAATDNTLAEDENYFWSLGHLRMVMLVNDKIRAISSRKIGTVGYGTFREEVFGFMDSMIDGYMIRGYDMTIDRADDLNTVRIDLSMQPYFGIRTIYFQTEVGPII